MERLRPVASTLLRAIPLPNIRLLWMWVPAPLAQSFIRGARWAGTNGSARGSSLCSLGRRKVLGVVLSVQRRAIDFDQQTQTTAWRCG